MQEHYIAIGETAGKIYRALQGNSTKPLSALQKEIKVSDTALFQEALGWLAREAKIEFKKNGVSTSICLCPEELNKKTTPE